MKKIISILLLTGFVRSHEWVEMENTTADDHLMLSGKTSLLNVPSSVKIGTDGCLTNANQNYGDREQTKLKWHSNKQRRKLVVNHRIADSLSKADKANNHQSRESVINNHAANKRHGVVEAQTQNQNLLTSAPQRGRDSKLKGLTLWVNEFMQIGHAQYDLWVMQMLASAKVRRIVLQRAPCYTPNSEYCFGYGTWAKFFVGMYAAMIDALQPGVPIFMRFKPTDTAVAHFLSINSKGKVVDNVHQTRVLHIENEVCFESVVWKNYKCFQCFYDHFVSIQTAEKFKTSAYKMLGFTPERSLNNTIGFYKPNMPVVITLAYRGAGGNGRVMQNIQNFINTLASAFKAPQFDFRTRHTPNYFSNETYVDDIRVVSETHILIAEHGAYQTNVIYMRRGALLIDLSGIYWENPAEGQNHIVTEKVAKNFGVSCRHVYLSGMPKHSTPKFDIKDAEIQNVTEIIKEYARAAPYLFVNRTIMQ